MFRNMRLGSILALMMMAALVGCTPATQGYTPPAQGSKIDNSVIKTAETKLLKSSEAERDQFIAKVKKQPEKYPPVVFYLMSRALFEKGEKDGREKKIYLTTKGAEFSNSLFSSQKNRILSAFKKSSPDEVLYFKNVLKRIIK